MVTRFRLTSDATAPAVSPTGGTYTHDQGTRRKLKLTDTSTLTTSAYTPDAADHLVAGDSRHVQFVSNPLDAGAVFTSGDTLKYCIQGTEGTASDNIRVFASVYVYDSAGTTLRATLRSIQSAGPAELPGSLNSRFFSTTLTASYTLVANDILVVDFYVSGTPVAGSGTNGHNGSLRWGSGGAGGDLAENDSQTGTTLDPWIEFATTVTEASGAVTGTIAVTQAPDVGALSGTVANPITGTIAVTQAAQTMAATGTETFTGTIAVSQADQVGALVGTVANPVTGTIAATQDPNVGALSGNVIAPITGTIAAIQADQTGVFVGAESFTGTIGANQDPNTGALSGTVANPITGVIGATQADQIAAFLGTIVSDGTLNSIQDDQTGLFTGTVANPVTGTIGASQADQTGAFTGTNTPPAVTGTITVTQDDQTGSFTGIAAFGIVGVLGGIQQDQTGSFTGIALVAVTGTIAVTQDPNIGAFTGTVLGGAVTGVLGAVQDPNVGSFTATVTNPILNPPGTITCVLSTPTAVCVLAAPTAACTILPVNVIAGSNVEITTTFHKANGDLADPTTVAALIQHPDGTTSAPTPTSSSVGIWTTVIPTDDPGFWFYQISGAGNDLDVVCVGSFCAQPSLVLV